MQIKELLSKLIDGMHQEFFSKSDTQTFDEHLGVVEYTKLRAACGLLEQRFVKPDLVRLQRVTYREGDLMYFRHNELKAADTKLQQLIGLLDLKIHNYSQLEKF